MSAPKHSGKPAGPLTGVQWLICIIAAIGFAFDTYELLMAPLIIPDAVREFYGQQQAKEAKAKQGSAEAGKPAEGKEGGTSVAAAAPAAPPVLPPEAAKAAAAKRGQFVAFWKSTMFFLPAIFGGIFGLLGGYLTDRLGRRRVLTWSILLYAFGAFAAGFSTSLPMLLFFRCLVFIGVCVEFVAAVAWLAELFDNPIQREKVLGYTQAFSSVGGLLVALAYACAVAWSAGKPASLFWGIQIPYVPLPEIHLPNFLSFLGEIPNHTAAWRYTLMSGVLPAIPLILVRPFLPESNSWQEKLASGKLRRPSFGELFSPNLRQTTIVTAVMFACSLGAAFGSIQQIPDIVPGLPEVKAEQKKAVEEAVAKAEAAGKPLTPPEKKNVSDTVARKTAAEVTKVQEVGGLIGRFVLAALAVVVVSRRSLLRIFQIPGLILIPLVFGYAAINSLPMLYVGMFLAGFCTVAQLSFWGNYLPLVYPVHLRGTGESFAANIGGRLIGTSMAAVVTYLATANFLPGEVTGDGGSPTKLAYAAAIVGTAMYLVGSIACFYLPEPKPEAFDE